MVDAKRTLNPAEVASKRALDEILDCLKQRKSFLVEAGAGAGKTYSLVKALQFLIENNLISLARNSQVIGCITYTNVAKDEIIGRIGDSPLVQCDTVHSFSWSLIQGFQKELKQLLPNLAKWPELIEEAGGIKSQRIDYSLGHRHIDNETISLHHDDVLELTQGLMVKEKFRWIVTSKYPVIFIDEYQDTNAMWMKAIQEYFLGQSNSPLFGFFGDHWQKIYGDGCGRLEHDALTIIKQEANFRSCPSIVALLNRMRPELPQSVVDPQAKGTVQVFHANDWKGERRKGSHWKEDLPADVAHQALEEVQEQLKAQGWFQSPTQSKILMLTHRLLASEQNYDVLLDIFPYSEDVTGKDHIYIAYFCDVLEPAFHAFENRKYGEMFSYLEGKIPLLGCRTDKTEWFESMQMLGRLRSTGKVGEVLSHLRNTQKPRLPDSIEEQESRLQKLNRDQEEIPPDLEVISRLHDVNYKVIEALVSYLSEHSPFETQHGTKGAEFDDVLVVVGRGWNRYNWGQMLEWASTRIPAGKEETYERNRNLFYVVCSRPKKNLAILFTQLLTSEAMTTLNEWFGHDAIVPLNL